MQTTKDFSIVPLNSFFRCPEEKINETDVLYFTYVLIGLLLIGAIAVLVYYLLNGSDIVIQQSNLKLVIKHLEVLKQLQEVIVNEIQQENIPENDTKAISKIIQQKMMNRLKPKSKGHGKINKVGKTSDSSDNEEVPNVVLENIRARLRNRIANSKAVSPMAHSEKGASFSSEVISLKKVG